MHRPWRNLATLFLACVFYAASAIAQEKIQIVGPSLPVGINDDAILTVTNLTDDELPRVSYTSIPSEGVRLLTNRPWSGHPYLQFRAQYSGQYTITITLNGWRNELDEAVSVAKAAKVDSPLVTQLEALAKEFTAAFPVRVGSAQVEVAGTIPFPKPPVTPPVKPPVTPIDPSLKVTRVTYVYEQQSNRVPPPVSAALNKLNRDSGGSVVASEFEQNTLNPAGQTPTQYKIPMDAARQAGLPALVVQSGNTVLRVVKAPTTEAQVLEAAK